MIWFKGKTINGEKKKKRKNARSLAKEKAWDAFSRYIRLRDAIKTTGDKEYCVCVTCEKSHPAFGNNCIQAGHAVRGRGNAVLFNEELVHGQCWHCNHILQGNEAVYKEKMIVMYGVGRTEELYNLKGTTVNYTEADFVEIKHKYNDMYKELEGNL